MQCYFIFYSIRLTPIRCFHRVHIAYCGCCTCEGPSFTVTALDNTERQLTFVKNFPLRLSFGLSRNYMTIELPSK